MEKRPRVRKCLAELRHFFIVAGILSLIPAVILSVAVIGWVTAEGDAGEDIEGHFIGDVEPAVDEYGYEIEGEYVIEGRLYEVADNGTVIYQHDNGGGDDDEKSVVTIIILIILIVLVMVALIFIMRKPSEMEFDDE